MGSAAETKVYKFHVPMLIEKNVFGFDVPMAKSALLEVEQGGKDLMEYSSGFFFRHWTSLIDLVKELSVPAVLHEDVDLVLLLDDLVDLGNILMEEVFLQLYFPLYGLDLIDIVGL